MEEENLVGELYKKIGRAEDFLSQAKELYDRALKELSKEERKRLPVFPGIWSEKSVKKYLEKLKKFIDDPIRYRNRERLEKIGIQTEDIPEDVFDDSVGIEEIITLFNQLKEFEEKIADILIEKGLLSKWLKESTTKAKEELKKISEVKVAIQRIFKCKIEEQLKKELIQRSIENIGFINSAEEIISKINFMNNFEILIDYDGDFNKFYNSLNNIYKKLIKLQDEYGISRIEIAEFTKGKSLIELVDLLEEKIKKYSEKKRDLENEWKMYITTLKSIGIEAQYELPSTINKLEREVEKLRKQCLDNLGYDGLKLLKFMRGEEDFPEEISIDSIRKTLEILRPLFIKFLKGEA